MPASKPRFNGLFQRVKAKVEAHAEPFECVLSARCMSLLTGVPYLFMGPSEVPHVAVLGYAMPIRMFVVGVNDVIHGARFHYNYELICELGVETGYLNRGLPKPMDGNPFEIARALIERMWKASLSEGGVQSALDRLRQFDVDYALLVGTAMERVVLETKAA